jgi:hypothetical protein
MSGPVFRICVLLLALLIQAGGFRSEAASRSTPGWVTVRAVHDFDICEADGSEEPSAADEAPEMGVPPNAAIARSRVSSENPSWPVSDGLPPGRSPSGAPFKPPRARAPARNVAHLPG